jgi:hypothetical protein
MSWINDLKIAVIEENIQKISVLIKTLPNFTDLDKAKEALSLVGEAIKITDAKKTEVLNTINKIKKTKEYLSS